MLPRIALDRINVQLRDRHVLRDISWTLEAGQHWAIVGANGSGKSTLLRVIAGTQWIAADGGTRAYSPDGVRSDVVARAATWIRSVSAEQHERYVRLDLPLAGRAVIGSGFDNSLYLHRTLGTDEATRVDALIEAFDLSSFAARPVRELSAGQIRRLLIARALVGAPRAIVFDEFTNGLDRVARREVLGFLDRLAPQVTLVVASHRAADFPAATTHTATLADGRIVSVAAGRPAQGRPTALLHPVSAVESADRPVLIRIEGADVYRGRSLVLKNVNWQLRRGEHTLVRGSNGAGKTTFAGLIAGTISAATGADILRFGERGPFDIWQLKERIAHISDDLQIAYDRGETVEEVVASGFPASIGLFVQPTSAQYETVAAIIDRIGLAELRERPLQTLSFGERRKVLIARSLVRRPAVFILDEVVNGLDSGFRRALAELLAELAGTGTTIVAIAHDEDDEVASFARRVSTIERSTVIDSWLAERSRDTEESVS